MIDRRLNGLLPSAEHDLFRQATCIMPARCIRLRPARDGVESLPMAVEPVPWFARGRWLIDCHVRPSQFLQYAAADYYIQDAGSLLALGLLDAQPDEVICDLCAAPGGKASGIVEALGKDGFLLANEPIGSRGSILRYALARTGNLRYAVAQRDPQQLAIRFAEMFDAVLVDAPCSGQALVARGKREGNAFDIKQVEHSASRQRRILLEAIKLLKPGGRLIYSTCTFAIEENEAQIRWLQERFPGVWEPISSPALERWASPLEPGCYRLWPHREPTAGAFAAGLRLKEAVGPGPVGGDSPSHRHGRHHRSDRRRPASHSTGRSPEACFGQLAHAQSKTLATGEFVAIATDLPAEFVGRLDDGEWPRLAALRAGTWKPEYALAMLTSEWFSPIQRLELGDSAARKYMLGEVISNEDCSAQGRSDSSKSSKPENSLPWAVVTWQDKSLGWAKLADKRFNNHLPKPAILSISAVE